MTNQFTEQSGDAHSGAGVATARRHVSLCLKASRGRAVPTPIRFGFISVGVLALALLGGLNSRAADDASNSNAPGLVPLKLKLPEPVFAGTPREAPKGVDMEPTPTQPPPPLMVPSDVRNVAPGKKITCSDKGVTAAALARITDGNKSAEEDSAALLRKGLQWIQFDLGAAHEIFAIVFWHAHDTPKVYRSVIVQVADDADFTQNVRVLYNNDRDNSAGLGAGMDRQYFETYMGKTVNAKGVRARFVRLYSHGSTDSALNEYTEVEIYGRPAR
jgi:hypothetical protein